MDKSIIFKNHPSTGKVVIDPLKDNCMLRISAISKITMLAIKRTDVLKDSGYTLQFRAAGIVSL